jgi:protein TonB
VRTDGIEFPYPGYLNNIVRQIALNFQAPEGSLLNADVAFTIRRDGSVADVRVVRGSGDYEFDLEARGAVEAAAPRFGSLPAGFSDDALPVVFSFDPKFIR